MNTDDIIRMAREAGAGEPESLYGRTDYFAMTEYELERFAKLIVRECCFTGEQWADGLINPTHYAFVNKQIKSHFGVEE